MSALSLQEEYSVRDWNKVMCVLKQAHLLQCKIDYSGAHVDERVVVVFEDYNSNLVLRGLDVSYQQRTFDPTNFVEKLPVELSQEFEDALLNEAQNYEAKNHIFNVYFLFRRFINRKIEDNFFFFLVGFFNQLFSYFADLIYFTVRLLRKRTSVAFQKQIMFTDVLSNCYTMGVQALPIVMFLSMILGVIIALQAVIQLRNFGAQLYAVDLVVLSFFKEMGLFVVTIVLAARSGGGVISKIGMMRIADEWDALKILGIDPEIFLLKPKLIAFAVIAPLLGYVSCLFGMLGGYVILNNMLGINSHVFISVISGIKISDFFAILIKIPVVGFAIGAICTFETTKIAITSQSVVNSITRGVVYSIFASILIDMIFNIVLVSIR